MNKNGVLKIKIVIDDTFVPQKQLFVAHDGNDVLVGIMMPEAIQDLVVLGYDLPSPILELSKLPLTP